MLNSIAIILVTTALSGTITYFVGKTIMKSTKKDILNELPNIIDYLKEEMEEYARSNEGAKLIYGIGALIGNGARQGLGIQTGKGKFKFEDLFAQIASGFVQQYLGSEQKTPPQPSERGNLNI